MANAPTIKLTLSDAELAKVKRALDKWGDVVKKRLQQATAITATDIERDAKETRWGGNFPEDIQSSVIGATALETPPYKEQSNLMPHIRTGILKSSIRTEKATDDLYFVRAGDSSAPYAGFVEFGTKNARPHPFMHPAAEMNKRKWKERIEKAIKDPTGVKET